MMSLQTLKYVLQIAENKSFSKAAKNLYLSQAALSTSVRELEMELGTQLFIRNNKGVVLTKEGEDFLLYAKDIVDRSELLLLRYQNNTEQLNFSVSTQPFPFAVRAFQNLMNSSLDHEYNITIRETSYDVTVNDVITGRSKIGIIAVPQYQLAQVMKQLNHEGITFEEVGILQTYVFLRKNHPLANCNSLTLDQLTDYPYVTFDCSEDNYSHIEEMVVGEPFPKTVHVSDRASKLLLVRGTDGFSIGVDLPNYNSDLYFRNRNTEIEAIPFINDEGPFIAGCIYSADVELSDISKKYRSLLKEQISHLQLPVKR